VKFKSTSLRVTEPPPPTATKIEKSKLYNPSTENYFLLPRRKKAQMV
jgi:hypothetical protein